MMGDATAAYGTAGAGVIVSSVAAYGVSGESVPVEGMLLNDAIVVRGGIATEEGIIKALKNCIQVVFQGFLLKVQMD